ncbi:hypothetical protein BOTBODRAFT_38612 [Botryobasidium botryosum FD-172 SS1]|uniref:Uncharacterized protein n=1 Tax=Botryobasidium botryosum (strain FD-172 SS1) TaxID=930990 RepID=A0A067LZA5_BOTB1|nr:hypothetical protein BOTBODRAFT_38612 [Botryobasidium botryosum FD-172 SS1]
MGLGAIPTLRKRHALEHSVILVLKASYDPEGSAAVLVKKHQKTQTGFNAINTNTSLSEEEVDIGAILAKGSKEIPYRHPTQDGNTFRSIICSTSSPALMAPLIRTPSPYLDKEDELECFNLIRHRKLPSTSPISSTPLQAQSFSPTCRQRQPSSSFKWSHPKVCLCPSFDHRPCERVFTRQRLAKHVPSPLWAV